MSSECAFPFPFITFVKFYSGAFPFDAVVGRQIYRRQTRKAAGKLSKRMPYVCRGFPTERHIPLVQDSAYLARISAAVK